MGIALKPRVAVVGAGIVGVTIAYFLGRAGAAVHIFEQSASAGRGVTRQSFGWVNSVMAPPETSAEIYLLRKDAHLQYSEINQAFDGRLFGMQRGSVSWAPSALKTEAFAKLHADRGGVVNRIGRRELTSLVPQVSVLPELAVHAPNDIAIEASDVSLKLLEATLSAGSQAWFGQKVQCITTKNGMATGVRLNDAEIEIDFVVVAAGAGTRSLIAEFAPNFEVGLSSAALVTIAVRHTPLDIVLNAPGIEVRSIDQDALVVSEAFHLPDTAEARRALGGSVVDAASRTLTGLKEPRLVSVDVGQRPIPRNGVPIVDRTTHVENVFVAVAHPGVVLAPAVARTITDLVFQRDVSTPLGRARI